MADTQARQTLSRQAMLEEIETLKRRAGLEWHLTGNFYPPLPVTLVTVAEQALAIANSYEAQYGVHSDNVMAQELSLPDGMSVNGKDTMSVYDIIDWLRLDSMVYDVFEIEQAEEAPYDAAEEDYSI